MLCCIGMNRYDNDILTARRTLTDEERADVERCTQGLDERAIQRALFWKYSGSARRIVPNFTPAPWFECDLFVMTRAAYTIEFEIKLSRSDYCADFNKQRKHARLSEMTPGKFLPTRFFYVTPEFLVLPRDVPAYAGLVYCRFRNEYRPSIPLVTVVRQAPRLSKTKVGAGLLEDIGATCYHRFWRARFALDDYRADRGGNAPL